MITPLQLKINSDQTLTSFIREYPNWYKLLNRNPHLFNDFIRDMKDKYKLTTTDRINKTLTNINMIQSILEVLK